jgi:hypothetical protein
MDGRETHRSIRRSKQTKVLDCEVSEVYVLPLHVSLHFLNGCIKKASMSVINQPIPLKDCARRL